MTATMMVLFTGVMVRGLTLANSARQQTVAAHGEQDAGLAVHHHQGHREDRDHRAGGQNRAPSSASGDVVEDGGQAGLLLVLELLPGLRAEGGDGDQHVDAGDDQQCGDDRPGHGPLRVLDLVTGGRHRIQADVGEEDRAGRRADAGDPERREVGEPVGAGRR